MTAYAQARKDHEYLYGLIELYDEGELDAMRPWLMQNPTKNAACTLYEIGISQWFKERRVGRAHFASGPGEIPLKELTKVRCIAERYDADF